MTTDNFKHSFNRTGNGELVIFVHGALADERMWEEHSAKLKSDFEVISVTQRHFGAQANNEGNFGLNTHAEDLAGFISTVKGNRPVHLVGWSYGSDVVLNMLAKYPTIAASAFLYEPGCPAYLSEKELARFSEDANKMFGPIFALAGNGQIEAAVQALIDGSGGKNGYFFSQSQKARQQQLENAQTLPLQLNQNEKPVLNEELFAKLSIPLTIAYGSHSRLLFRVVSEAASRIIPKAKALCVACANHMFPLEQPEDFAELVKLHIVEGKR